MSDEGIDVVVAELVGPAELLLERVVLVDILGALAAAVVALTVTDDAGIIFLLDVIADIEVSVEGEGEVPEEVELRGGDGVHRVADALVLVEFVLPDDVAVDILVACVDLDAVGVIIISRVILLVPVSVQDVFAGVDVMQVDRIDRGDVAAVHERVDVSA